MLGYDNQHDNFSGIYSHTKYLKRRVIYNQMVQEDAQIWL